MSTKIPGYDFGKPGSARSPVSLDELRHLEASAGWTNEDAAVLDSHRGIFQDRAEEMVNAWRAEIGKQPHLAHWFVGPDGNPDENYKARVKARFVEWVREICRPHDQAWLDYQEEIGLRHTPAKKNATDGARTPELIPLRYLFAFTSVVTLSARRFFVEAAVEGEELRRLEEAWTKKVMLHVTLWSRAYTREGLW